MYRQREDVAGWLLFARLALVWAYAHVYASTASAAGECTMDRGDSATATFPIRLFGGAIRVPVDYTLYGDSALARSGRTAVLELHDLSRSGLASISIGNVVDAGPTLHDLPLLCTVRSLTVRQEARSQVGGYSFFTVIYDDKYYVTVLSSTDANGWKVLLRDFLEDSER